MDVVLINIKEKKLILAHREYRTLQSGCLIDTFELFFRCGAYSGAANNNIFARTCGTLSRAAHRVITPYTFDIILR